MTDAIRIAAFDESGGLQEVVEVALDNPGFDLAVLYYVKKFFKNYNLTKISKSEV